METPEVDYKKLYEASRKRLARVESTLEKQRSLTERYQQEKRQAEQEKDQIKQEKDLIQQERDLALMELDKLRRQLFGIKSDNQVKRKVSGQLDMFTLGASPAAQQAVGKELDEALKAAEKKARRGHPKGYKAPRMVLPDHLEREEVIIDPKGDLSDYRVIGQEVTEVLAMEPARFTVKRIIRRKWALKDRMNVEKTGVLIAPIPPRTVKRGLLDESVLAHLVISKYIDHLPLYRQQKIFERGGGIKIPASTLSGNLAHVCQELEPIYRALKKEALLGRYLQVDETHGKVLFSGKKGACHQGYFWAYHAPSDGIVFFEYQPGRDHQHPEKVLKDFRGVLQCDGYAVYQQLFKGSKRVRLLHCMAHIRRRFDESAGNDLERARYAVEKIAELYKIEKEIREADPMLSETEIVMLRMEHSAPLLDQLKTWMVAEYPKVLPKSPIGKAISYALSLWDNMRSYILHGHLMIDNNEIENAIRPIALGRRNHLFHGTQETAQHAAIVYSLFATCKKHRVNPQDWISDVLRKINDPEYEGKYSDLMPHRWKADQAL